jgi:hypothetical protein
MDSTIFDADEGVTAVSADALNAGTNPRTSAGVVIPADEKPAKGAARIGKVIGQNERQTFYMLQRGMLPAVKIGNSWFAYPTALRATFRPGL